MTSNRPDGDIRRAKDILAQRFCANGCVQVTFGVMQQRILPHRRIVPAASIALERTIAHGSVLESIRILQ